MEVKEAKYQGDDVLSYKNRMSFFWRKKKISREYKGYYRKNRILSPLYYRLKGQITELRSWGKQKMDIEVRFSEGMAKVSGFFSKRRIKDELEVSERTIDLGSLFMLVTTLPFGKKIAIDIDFSYYEGFHEGAKIRFMGEEESTIGKEKILTYKYEFSCPSLPEERFIFWVSKDRRLVKFQQGDAPPSISIDAKTAEEEMKGLEGR
jgi:hypothetical protein